ncbi:unnamed protein product [Hymenolepis diminuta]|uniref:Peptidase S54 rhomboid domain-containing protein n=1 Tax=Hymenolepis diminuta TaxID=6216 RepID=A0A564Z9E8_HYMDI|nr:unnamed protein product [Hymenolepis diminuta]
MIFIQMAVFAHYAILSTQVNDPKNEVTAFSGLPPGYNIFTHSPKKRHQVWYFLSYMFRHDGYIHLNSDCLFQLTLGLLLELVHKSWRVGIVYNNYNLI